MGGTLLLGSTATSNRLEQIYYLGTFDPDNRVPPTFFRIRVRGQASFLSSMKFGSGWVPAGITDSLAENVTLGKTPMSAPAEGSFLATRPYGSRLQQYGPEGFRNVPDDQRLVIVMGSSPQAFFQMVDRFTVQARGVVGVNTDQSRLKAQMDAIEAEQAALDKLKTDYDSFLK